MNKKTLFSIIAICFCVILTTIVIFLIPEKTQEIKLNSCDKAFVLSLGKYKVKNYAYQCYANEKDAVSFEVESGNIFYNEVIKTSEYYNSELDFDVDDYIAYGYLIKDNYLFAYNICENLVTIETAYGAYKIYENIENLQSSDYDYFYIPGNLDLNLENEDFEHFYYGKESFDNLVTLISFLDQNIWLYENDCLYLKGINSKDGSISSNYLIKLRYSIEINQIIVEHYNE